MGLQEWWLRKETRDLETIFISISGYQYRL